MGVMWGHSYCASRSHESALTFTWPSLARPPLWDACTLVPLVGIIINFCSPHIPTTQAARAARIFSTAAPAKNRIWHCQVVQREVSGGNTRKCIGTTSPAGIVVLSLQLLLTHQPFVQLALSDNTLLSDDRNHPTLEQITSSAKKSMTHIVPTLYSSHFCQFWLQSLIIEIVAGSSHDTCSNSTSAGSGGCSLPSCSSTSRASWATPRWPTAAAPPPAGWQGARWSTSSSWSTTTTSLRCQHNSFRAWRFLLKPSTGKPGIPLFFSFCLVDSVEAQKYLWSQDVQSKGSLCCDME